MKTEGSPGEAKRLSPQDIERHIFEEDNTLIRSIEERKTRGELTDQEAGELIELYGRKHDAERSTGRIFKSIELFDEYDAHKGTDENFFPDSELPLEQGEKYSFEGEEWVYAGLNEGGLGILRRVDENGSLVERPLEQGERQLLFGFHQLKNTSIGAEEGEHHSATQEPPSAIEAVAQEESAETAPDKKEEKLTPRELSPFERRVIKTLKNRKGDTIPRDVLEKNTHLPEVAEYLAKHPAPQVAESSEENTEIKQEKVVEQTVAKKEPSLIERILSGDKNKEVGERAQTEIARPEGKKPDVRREHFFEVISHFKDGDNPPPWKMLKKYWTDPRVEKFVVAHPELKPKEETKIAPTNKEIERAIEAEKMTLKYPVAESFEMQQKEKQKKKRTKKSTKVSDDFNTEEALARLEGEGGAGIFWTESELVEPDVDDDIERMEGEGGMIYAKWDDLSEEEKNSFKAFDPEKEIGRILSASKEERKKLLREYKEKLAWQRRGLAEAQAFIENEIRANPDMTLEQFRSSWAERSSTFFPTSKQHELAETIFKEYQEKHAAVEKARADHPVDSDLFKAVFGVFPKGAIEVIKGPLTLYFRIHNSEDYALAFSSEGMKKSPQVTSKQVQEANITGGARLSYSLIPGTNGCILIENSKDAPFEGSAVTILQHEEQHAINELIQREGEKEFEYNKNFRKYLDTAYRIVAAEENIETKSASECAAIEAEVARMKERMTLLDERRLRDLRERLADWRVADEIIAYMKEGGRATSEIYLELTKKKEAEGLYDFLDNYIPETNYPTPPLRHLFVSDKKTFKLLKEIGATFQVSKKRIFTQEYHQAIKSGLDAYERLRGAGYKEEAIRTILLEKPLVRWEKIANRLIEQWSIGNDVAEKYAQQFGITKEELRKIENFGELSSGQQLLVLQHLEQITLRDIKKGAAETQKEEWKNTPWWKKALLNAGSMGSYSFARVKSIEKKLRSHSAGQDDSPERAQALAKHLADIEALSHVVAEGPDVKVAEGGQLEMAYISHKDFFDLKPENLEAADSFNQAATVFAQLPHEWGYAPKDEKEKRENARYEEAKKRYEGARRAMLTLFVEQMKKRGEDNPERAAMLFMNSIDERLELNQLFNAHPDAEKALRDVADQNVIAEGLKDFWRDKGQYIALGSAIRIGAGIVTGGVGAIALGGIIGGAVGGLQGHSEAKKLIRERRVDRRMSIEDEREHVAIPGQFDASGQPIERGIKEFTDATFFSDRIERLTVKLEQAVDANERTLLEGKIAKTTALMEEKLNAGLINFGGSSLEGGDIRKGAHVANRLSFMQALGRGRVIEAVDPVLLQGELERIVSLHQEKIETLRKNEVIRVAAKAGLMRAGFALAGGYLTGKLIDLLKEGGASQATTVGGTGERVPHTVETKNDVPDLTRNYPDAVSRSMEQGARVSGAAGSGNEVATLAYAVKPGDNLTHIIKEHLGIMRDLTPTQQENVIQNFIHQLSLEEMKELGITDVNKIQIGQNIQIDKLSEILLAKEVGGENIITHAQHLGGNVVDHSSVGPSAAEEMSGVHPTEAPVDLEKTNTYPDQVSRSMEQGVVLENKTENGVVASVNTVKSGDNLPESVKALIRSQWNEIPDGMKYQRSFMEASHYLVDDLHRIFGPDDVFGNPPKEWVMLQDQPAEKILFAKEGEVIAASERDAIMKIRRYAEENKFALPWTDEPLDDFLVRAHQEKIMRDGPSRPLTVQSTKNV